ncbi:ATP-grasp fold amidoligase family protein [Tenacibaculum aiptasiae]|uniref:ATP-grasp fold amidoligase family protein n=1 Tax=Tenacibaculum aiptasiae TaxID=426481 RepID=UPI00232DA235|nr:ATP-grasp fold amidoligase family protein [Tenacibaculum aiptasiae]
MKAKYFLYRGILFFLRQPIIRNMTPDKWYLSIMYYILVGEELNLDNPSSFNEKIQWLKLYDFKPEYTQMVDKYEVRNYVAERIGEEYLIPLIGGPWNNFEEINFELLPNRFVLKCTHDSGGVVICTDKSKFDKSSAREKINNSLNRNYYWGGREKVYKDIKPRIIAENYLVNEEGAELKDYKIMVFNGKAKCSFVCSERFSGDKLKVTFFDLNWNRLPFERRYPQSSVSVKRPENYKLMIELAETLANKILFNRVDFYELNGRVYFGEMTFYPGGGLECFNPKEWDTIMGGWLELPTKNE